MTKLSALYGNETWLIKRTSDIRLQTMEIKYYFFQLIKIFAFSDRFLVLAGPFSFRMTSIGRSSISNNLFQNFSWRLHNGGELAIANPTSYKGGSARELMKCLMYPVMWEFP
jgi:hypothetical protein